MRYHELLEKLRQSFPQPKSDRVHDAYFVFSILRALDEVDRLKSEIPLLGTPGVVPDYDHAAKAVLPEGPSTIEDITPRLVEKLHGLPNWGHPRNQVNVVAPPSIPSIIGSLLPAIYNPNLVSEESAMRFLEDELEVWSMAARLLGFDPERAAGVFTSGGTATNLYGVRVGIEKAIPGAMRQGLRGDCVIIASKQGHYSKLNVASWTGVGSENVVEIPTHASNDMIVSLFEEKAREVIAAGKKIGCIIATMGTTDAFGIDDIGSIVAVRDRLVDELGLDYRPHVHADAVIGWAWSVFNDYDFERNELDFRPRTTRALANACRRISKLHLADSIGIDFHKTGFCPYVSSLFLLKDRADFDRIARPRESMPYLYQTGDLHPGFFTLETSRPGTGVLAALGNLLLFGKEGLRAILGHLVEMAEVLREHLEGHAATTVLNGENVGTVTLFRAYPDGVDTWSIKEREAHDPAAREELRRHNEYQRKIFEYLYDEAMRGDGILISMTGNYRSSDFGDPIAALKSYCLSPFIRESDVELLVDKVLEARRR
ncbi:MAG TPA: pyridoxal-dependent decarboxylase, partial [Planctomycetota bacterium]|nr:pyridoxal-dependent decarboxylase [Planctomycetota bacterium]